MLMVFGVGILIAAFQEQLSFMAARFSSSARNWAVTAHYAFYLLVPEFPK